MIFFTGDTHGEKSRFKSFKKAKIKKGDTLIVCGDFGFIWDGSSKEKRIAKWIGKRRYNVCFVDGYNDNLKLINDYPEVEFCGGKAINISGRLFMLKRGELFNINDRTIFAFGGGDSLERENSSYVEASKLPTIEEMQNAVDNLKRVDNHVDYIVTHEAPSRIKLFINMDNNEVNHLNTFLETVSEGVKFKKWFIGKYHNNKIIPPCYHMLFTDIAKS